MYAVLTPDLFTIINDNGDEFNLPVYSREYFLIAEEGYRVEEPEPVYSPHIFRDCFGGDIGTITIEQFIFNIRKIIFVASGDKIIPDWLASLMGMAVLSVFDSDENVHNAQLPINFGIVYKKR